MARGKEELLIEVVAETRKAITELKKVTKELQKTGKATQETDKKSKLSLKNMQAGFKNLIAPVVAVTGAAVAMKKVFDFSKEGAAIQRLEDAGTRLANVNGQNFDAISRSIQRASGNTVSHLDAISQANIAMRLGVAQTPAEFDKLTTAAIALGRATGRTANESVADLTTGIGRQSKMILDNLGIVYQADKVYKAHAITLGKNANQLTDSEKKQALLNLALEAAIPLLDENGNLIDDAASSYERFEAGIANATDRLKEGLADAFDPVIEKVAGAIEEHNKLGDIIDKFGLKYVDFIGYVDESGKVWARTSEELERYGKVAEAEASRWTKLGEHYTTVAEEIGSSFTSAWKKAIPDPEKMIAGWSAYLDYMRSDIPVFVEEVEYVNNLLAEGLLTPQQADAAFSLISTGLANERIKMGGDVEAIEKALAEALGVPVEEATQKLEDYRIKFTGMDNMRIRTWVDQFITKHISTETTGVQPFKRGGTATHSMLVGEAGPELIINGQVIPTGPTKAMLARGLVPDARFVVGGDMGGGGASSNILSTNLGDRVHDLSYLYTSTTPAVSAPVFNPFAGFDFGEPGPGDFDPWNPFTGSGGGGGGGGGVNAATGEAAATVLETIVETAVSEAVETAGAVAAQASVEAKAASESQRMETMRGNVVLEQMRDLLRDQASAEDMRSIMEETQETSGF